MDLEKSLKVDNSPVSTDASAATTPPSNDEAEPFATDTNGVHINFRTVSWIKAAIFLLKMTFATGVLSIPAALYTLGAVAGAIFIVFWGLLNTYMAYIQGQFKLAHPSVHTVADAAHIAIIDLGCRQKTAYVVREVTGLGALGLSIALNAVSKHSACSIVFGLAAYLIVATVASIRKIEHLSWITWLGFITLVIAILLVVIAVTIPDRPSAAPKTGDFDLGFSPLPPANTTFVAAWAASLAIYASSANTSGFVPVISEMRKPEDFFKSLYTCMTWVTSSYLALGLTWVTSPALGSAGPTIKIIAYAIAIPGLIATGMICVHISAKSVFVRLLRGTRHLTENTKTHWMVWLSCTYGTGAAGYVLSEAVPFFSSLVSLIGALGFGPLGICVPVLLWFSLHKGTWQRSALWNCAWILQLCVFALGLLVTVGSTYATVVNIVAQYNAGQVGSAFSCADNSGTLVSS
ncbi:N amino acid transport system protein [Teratosphaeria destructans]|uniref:N amino acid transport system protein n=1 Tax=Teratosphaeria destructans TaxID=418781 RepID=A0A9W7VY53_9PEZI|nr:N amino acid transport system protein [Teratosphaeria destructans]